MEVVSGTAEAESETVITPAGVRGIWTHLKITDVPGSSPSLKLGTRTVLPDGSIASWTIPNLNAITATGHSANNFHTLQSPNGVEPNLDIVYVSECPIIPPIWRAYVTVGNANAASYKVSYIYDMA